MPWLRPGRWPTASPPRRITMWVCDTCGALTDVPAATLAATITAAQAATGYALTPKGLTLPGRAPRANSFPCCCHHRVF